MKKAIYFHRTGMKETVIVFLIIAGCLFSSLSGNAQNTILPSQFVTNLASIAPHRPPMQRDTAGVHIFHGGLLKYKHHENEHSLERWRRDYPNEVNAYIIAIRSYLNTHTNTVLSGLEAEIFCDFKSQWVMLAEILDLEIYQQ